MKKSFVYLSISILLSLQACNNNSPSKNMAADSTITDTTTAAITNNDSTVNQDTVTSGKTVTRIDASEVPGSVITAFKSKYPSVSNVKWVTGTNKKGKTFYRVRWQTSGKEMMAMFKNDGSFIKEKQLQ